MPSKCFPGSCSLMTIFANALNSETVTEVPFPLLIRVKKITETLSDTVCTTGWPVLNRWLLSACTWWPFGKPCQVFSSSLSKKRVFKGNIYCHAGGNNGHLLWSWCFASSVPQEQFLSNPCGHRDFFFSVLCAKNRKQNQFLSSSLPPARQFFCPSSFSQVWYCKNICYTFDFVKSRLGLSRSSKLLCAATTIQCRCVKSCNVHSLGMC